MGVAAAGSPPFSIHRPQAVVLETIGDEAVVVSTTGMISREV